MLLRLCKLAAMVNGYFEEPEPEPPSKSPTSNSADRSLQHACQRPGPATQSSQSRAMGPRESSAGQKRRSVYGLKHTLDHGISGTAAPATCAKAISPTCCAAAAMSSRMEKFASRRCQT